MSEQSKDEPVVEPERDRKRRGIVAGWGCLPVGVAVMLAVVLVGAVGAAGWWLGSSNDDEDIEFEEATSIGRDPFTTDGLILASEVKDVPGPTPTNVPATPSTQLFGGSGDQKVCDPAAIVAFLEANPKKAAAWVAALNADKFLSWSGGRRKVQVGEIAAYVAELTPSVLAVDTRVTNHGYKNGKATPRQSTLAKGTAVLIDSHGMPRVRCACGNPLTVPSGFTVAAATSTSVDVTTTDPPSTTTTDDTLPTTTTTAPACGTVPPLSDALQVTTAPVDFDGDGTPDVLRVYRLGVVWHARVEIAGVVVDDDVIAGPGPTMAAIGGATVDGDAFEEAWIRVGGTPPADAIVGLFTFRGCDLQRVVSDENGAPYAFPIILTSSQTYGLRCLGSNAGIEQLEMTSTDGGATYSGSGQEYTLLASLSPPTMAPGMTNTYTETNSSPGFAPHHQFTCDGLGPTIP